MVENFWQSLGRPFFVLAPMAEVTDVVFREFMARHGAPDVFFTEFVSCKGLLSEKGRPNLMRDLFYTERQRPIVAQVFGGDPKDFEETARLVRALGFDGMDINMGCPDKKVEKQGAGSALIKDPKRAQEIILSAKRGAQDMPISVKTRIGYNTIATREWIESLCEAKPATISLHARTRKEMSEVEAHWDQIAIATHIAHAHDIVLVGNGDVRDRCHGEKLARESGADGIMMGRGVYGNPWIFRRADCETVNVKRKTGNTFPVRSSSRDVERPASHPECVRMQVLAELIVMYDGFWGDAKNYEILKRFFKSYLHGFLGAKEMRVRMMETKTAIQALDILQKTIREYDESWEIPKYEKILLASPYRLEDSTPLH